jgi:hypothetical protein
MTIAKRPKLATKYIGPQAGERDLVSLEARCRIGDGEEIGASVLDLDASGCRVRGITAAVTKGARVDLWLGSIGPIAARLRWVKLGSAGLAFEEPLGEAALAEARATAAWAAPPRVIPLRRPTTDAET